MRPNANRSTFWARIVLDESTHTYVGYELLIEPQPSGGYLATFGKLGITPLELSSSQPSTDRSWTNQPIPSIPKSRVLQEGETMSIEIFVDPTTGDKLLDDVKINPPRSPAMRFQTPPMVARPVPTVSGTARDFSPADAELQLTQVRTVTLNGNPQGQLIPPNVHGPLVWLYLPAHGRFILSLVPRADLGFTKAGEVRGGVILFTLGKDSVMLESMRQIATGDTAYNLYVLHDPDWEPTSENQKSRPMAGTVAAAELSALKQK